MPRLTATVRPRAELGREDVAAMYRLYRAYFDATSADLFERDLEPKQFVIEVREGDALRGFSTLEVFDFTSEGTAARALFSGDTIVDHRYWGEQALPQAFCRFAGRIKAADTDRPLYWLLISKGYRTYRYLSVFAKAYYPNASAPTPPEMQSSLNALCTLRFGAAYRRELGIVSYPRSQGHLARPWAGVKPSAREHPEVRFFLERNPRFHEGDELCCLTELAAYNLRSFAKRAFCEGLNDTAHEPLLFGDSGRGSTLSRPPPAGADASARAAARHTRA